MAKLTLSDLSNLNNSVTAIAAINNNNQAIEAALENTLSRDGTSPNQMLSDIDMDSNTVTNLGTPTNATDAATKGYVDGLFSQESIDAAAAAAAAAATVDAEAARDAAEAYATDAATYSAALGSTQFNQYNLADSVDNVLFDLDFCAGVYYPTGVAGFLNGASANTRSQAAWAFRAKSGDVLESAAGYISRSEQGLECWGGTLNNTVDYNRNLATGNWVTSNCTITSATNSEGVSGNIRMTATGANATLSQPIDSWTSSRRLIALVRAKTLNGTFEISVDGGSSYINCNSQLAIDSFKLVDTVTYAIPATKTIIFRLTNSGDIVDIDFPTLINSQYSKSLIETTGTATGTRNADVVSIPLSYFGKGFDYRDCTIVVDYVIRQNAGGTIWCITPAASFSGSHRLVCNFVGDDGGSQDRTITNITQSGGSSLVITYSGSAISTSVGKYVYLESVPSSSYNGYFEVTATNTGAKTVTVNSSLASLGATSGTIIAKRRQNGITVGNVTSEQGVDPGYPYISRIGGINRFAVTFDKSGTLGTADNVIVSMNGSTPDSQVMSYWPDGPSGGTPSTLLTLGVQTTGGSSLLGYIRRITCFKTKLSNYELQAYSGKALTLG